MQREKARVHTPVGARARAHVRWRGLCSLLLSDPSGSSDSLHPGSPSDRPRLLSLLPPVCQHSLSSSSRAPSPPCLVSCHRSQPRSRRVEGFALPAQTAATFGLPLTSPPAVLLLAPHGPPFLLRRRRCVECDPDPTLFLRPH